MIGQTERGQKRAAHIEGASIPGKNHFPLEYSHVRILLEIVAKRLKKIGGNDRIIIQQLHISSGTMAEAEIISSCKPAVLLAANDLDPGILL